MADVVVGAKLEADASGAITNVRNFKKELKEAQAEVLNLSAKFGPMSKEVQNAAKKAAELNDQIQDAKQLTDAFNPDTKFRAFGASIQTVVGGFSALTGVMGLLGVESEEVQKTLLKVQSALALSQGIAQLQEGMQSIRNLGAVLVSSLGKGGLIGVVVALAAATGAWLLGFFDGAKKATESQKALNDSMKDYEKATAGAVETISKVRVALELARTGVISKQRALKTYNDTLGDSFGKTNDLATAERLLTDKADDYIKITALKAQANALFANAAEKASKALLIQSSIDEDLLTGNGLFSKADVIKIAQGEIQKLQDQSKTIENLAGGLIKQAETIASASKIDTRTSADIADAAKATADQAKAAADAATKRLEQAKKDFEEATRQRANKIGGPVLPGLEPGKTIEEQEIERVAATHKKFRDQMEIVEGEFTNDYLANIEARKANEQAEYDNKVALANASQSLLGAVSELLGKQTAAGKVLGIAQATINTYIGATEVLRAKTTLPEPLGTISKIINVAAIIATGLSAVKRIVSVPVPGAGGGGVPSVSAPLIPQAPGATRTALDQNSLNALGSATTRAFVVESDVTNNQERIRRLNRAARI